MTTEPRPVGGRYEVGEPLGRGGMADVRQGTDSRLGRTVAIKRLRVDLASDSTFQARFRREAQSAASLNHPAIVAVYDTGEEPDPAGSGVTVPYIVMEYVEGRTLREVLQEGRPILPERALEIAGGVLDALAYSHRAGIVHRDIKPGNVMLTPSGQVKVMDFGIARAVADTSATMTQTAAVIGTAQYLSPEQARGETVDTRSDLYSTGCLLYELLTGRPPFIGESPVSVAYQHVREDPAPPSAHNPDLSPAIDAIVLKSLTKDRNDRYQSAEEMRGDIDRVLAGQQATAAIAAVPTADDQATQVVPGPLPMPSPQHEQLQRREEYVGPPADDDLREANRGWVWALLLVVLIAAGIGGYFLYNSLKGNETPTVQQVQVPSVIGKKEPEARQAIAAGGLAIKVLRANSDQPTGTVIDQKPGATAMVNPGSEVTVTVSAGKKQVRVPDVRGQTQDQARTTLQNAGFAVGTVTQVDNPADEGKVVTTSPITGALAPQGGTINLTVSNGQSKVPNVVGANYQAAGKTLQAAKFSYRVTLVRTPVDEAAPGTVLRQDPASGSSAKRGSVVVLTVAQRPPTPTPTPPPPTPTPPPPTPTPPPTPILPTPPAFPPSTPGTPNGPRNGGAGHGGG